MDKKAFYDQCQKCGRPIQYAANKPCPCTCGIGTGEYGKKVAGCIRNKNPECPYNAVIPSVTVDDISGLKNLRDVFVHVSNINTTFYIDDKGRMTITWAGPVEIADYDYTNNPLNLRNQFVFTNDGAQKVTYYFDKTGTAQPVGGGGAAILSNDLEAKMTVGGIKAGTVYTAGTPLETLWYDLLTGVTTPTFANPYANLAYSNTTLLKVGATIPTGTAELTLNKGAIMLDGNKQADRSGDATNFNLVTVGADTDIDESNTTGTFTVPDLTKSTKGTIVMTGTIDHAEGPQPLDSAGDPYGTPLPAGQVTTAKTYEFVLPFYQGVSATQTIDVAQFAGFSEDVSRKENKSYLYDTNNEYSVFAYDASYGELTSILGPGDFEYIDGFVKTTMTVDGFDYRVYVSEYPSTDTGFEYRFIF